MRNKQKWIRVVTIAIVTALISGCGSNNASGQNNQEKNGITVATTSESGGLDPAGVIAPTYLAYSAVALDELLTFDAEGEIVYRGATSFEVNEERTEWVFHLREDAKWSDGSAVVAHDYLNTIKRALDPKSGNGYANYLFYIENAEAIYNQEAEMDSLGVSCVDEYTLVFQLETPCVFFLDLLRLPVYTPSHREYGNELASGWDTDPSRSFANGPYKLVEYVPQQYFVVEKNAEYWDAESVSLERITYQFFDSQQAMALAYETGEVDVAPSLLSTVMTQYEGKEDLVLTNAIATRYIYMNLELEVLQDVRVRSAINLGINREELCKTVGEDLEPTVNFVAKYMGDKLTGENFVDGAEAPFEENLERAKELLAEAGYPDGEGFPELTYNYPSLELDSDVAQVLQQQFKNNLGITLNLNAQELQVNYSERRAGNFELCRMNWTADFADPNTYLSMLLSNSTYNCAGFADSYYDDLVAQSDVETDLEKRSELMHQAEQYAIGEQFYIIPLFSMRSVNLIRPELDGISQIPATGALDYRSAEWK